MAAKVTHFIATLMRGGAEKQLHCLSTALLRSGWPQSVIVFSPGGVWAAHFREAGIPVYCLPPSRFKPWRLHQLGRLVAEQRPQIIMSWSPNVAVYARWAFGAGGPLRVMGVRGDLTLDSNTCQPQRRFWLLKNALERADCVVSNSMRNVQILQERGLAFRRFAVIHNIVTARGRATPAIPAPVPRIVAVGSLIPRKAYDVLLRAVAILAAERRKFELLVVGDGPERGRLEALTAELQASDRVRFLGETAGAQDLLATAHIMAHPARSEGLSNAILEAMAEGVPVVATPTGATPEMIEHDRTGLLVEAGCHRALAAALARLLDDPLLRGRLGQAGLERVRQQCSESHVVGHYEEVFSSLLAGR
jgi:glycosyltransferase involved in cell wall biosynthesis